MAPTLTNEQRLHLCIQDNDAGSVRSLLQEGVDVNWKNPLNQGNSPLHVACEFEKGNLSIIRMLLQHPRINVNDVNIHGSTPLHRACSLGKDAVVVELLLRPESNSAKASFRLGNGPTPLWKAASLGHTQCVRKLIAFASEHLDLQAKCAWDADHPRTAEEAAMVNKQKDIIKILSQYAADRDGFKEALYEELKDSVGQPVRKINRIGAYNHFLKFFPLGSNLSPAKYQAIVELMEAFYEEDEAELQKKEASPDAVQKTPEEIKKLRDARVKAVTSDKK